MYLYVLLGSAPLSVLDSSAFGVTSVQCDVVQDADAAYKLRLRSAYSHRYIFFFLC